MICDILITSPYGELKLDEVEADDASDALSIYLSSTKNGRHLVDLVSAVPNGEGMDFSQEFLNGS